MIGSIHQCVTAGQCWQLYEQAMLYTKTSSITVHNFNCQKNVQLCNNVIHIHCRSFKYAERVNTWEISFTSCQHKKKS